MGILKCKSCGGDLERKEGEQVLKCSYCGSYNTIPSTNDDQILKIYARGNLLRSQGEFDKAYSVFSQLLTEEKEEAEIYWNLILCKYGIIYIDDYDGNKKPTINRMSMSSILDDEDYKKVLSLADVVSKETYIKEANKIYIIQEDIQKIINEEKPYDIFISYKETDEFGDRTRDSVVAQDIYDALTTDGYRVFLSRVTLSNFIGKEYEPYIYSALYTSKIMILISTDINYINSVWVKNEWSRFLNMMINDHSKILIPCYKDIDPYDLPKEIRNKQGLDLSKLGFIQDLKIGVEKILGDKKKKNFENILLNQNSQFRLSVNGILKKVYALILENNFTEASKKMETVLDLDSENPLAYFYSFCIKYQLNLFSDECLTKIVNNNLTFNNYLEDSNIVEMFKNIDDESKKKFEEYFLGSYIKIANKIKDGTNIFREKGIGQANWFINNSLSSFVILPFENNDRLPFVFEKEFSSTKEKLFKLFCSIDINENKTIDKIINNYRVNYKKTIDKYLLSLGYFFLVNDKGKTNSIRFDNECIKISIGIQGSFSDFHTKTPYSKIDFLWYEKKSSELHNPLFLIFTKDEKYLLLEGVIGNCLKGEHDIDFDRCLNVVGEYNHYNLENKNFFSIIHNNDSKDETFFYPNAKEILLSQESLINMRKKVSDAVNEIISNNKKEEEARKEKEERDRQILIKELEKNEFISTLIITVSFIPTILGIVGFVLRWPNFVNVLLLICGIAGFILGIVRYKKNS